MYSNTDYENQVREFRDDNARKMVEELTNYVVGGNGARKAFYLSKGNILNNDTYAVQFDSNLAGYTATGISSVDTVNGIVNFTSAPALSGSVPTSLFILYWYQEFTNLDLDNFINYGLNKVQSTPPLSDPSAAFQNLSPALYNVVCLYATAQGNRNLAQRYAKLVDSSAEGTSSGKSKIPDMYMKMGQEFEDIAEKERLAAYGPAQGQATLVASTAARFKPANLYRMPHR